MTITNLTKEDLIKFEEDIATIFDAGKIRAPVHLFDGQEEQLIEVFKDIAQEDHIFCSWRSHGPCLLKGVPPDLLKKDILAGKSITLCYKDFNIFSSAIVAGHLPIALGKAIFLKRQKSKAKVFVFLGDMTSLTGTFNEVYRYAVDNDLPINFVIEDNNLSVCTDTRKVWNITKLPFEPSIYEEGKVYKNDKIYYYKYKMTKYKHAGTGKRIKF